MARRNYLSSEERTRFDSPPQLNSSQRLILLDLPQWADAYLRAIHTPTAKVGFVLQLGYFRVVTRFFVPDRFPQSDVDWVCGQLQLLPDQIKMPAYGQSRTLYRHRTMILTQLGYQSFEEVHRTELGREARLLTHLQTRPAQMLDALVDYLRQQRVEIPTYSLLWEIISGALDAFDVHLQAIIQAHLTDSDKALLGLFAESYIIPHIAINLLRE